MSSCVGVLADAHTVDEGDEQGDEPEHEDHYSDVPASRKIKFWQRHNFFFKD